MKKKIFFAVIIISAIGFTTVLLKKPSDKTVSLLSANVEALAQNESNEKKQVLISSGTDCEIVVGNVILFGKWYYCVENANGTTSCGAGCIVP